MTDESDRSGTEQAREFAKQASRKQTGILRESWVFVRRERKWFLAPILLVLLAAGAFVLLTSTAVAPLIYTVF